MRDLTPEHFARAVVSEYLPDGYMLSDEGLARAEEAARRLFAAVPPAAAQPPADDAPCPACGKIHSTGLTCRPEDVRWGALRDNGLMGGISSPPASAAAAQPGEREARERVVSVFSDSTAMPGNEAAFEAALDAYADVLRAAALPGKEDDL